MDNTESETHYDLQNVSDNSLLSLEVELAERLEDCYAEADFLERASAAVHDHLQQCDDSCPSPRDESEVASGTETVDNDPYHSEHYYDDDVNGCEADMEYGEDLPEDEFNDDENADETWDDNDEYYA